MLSETSDVPGDFDLVPVADRRAGGKRHQSVLLIGRVCNAEGAPACLVHDISRSGMMARFAAPPAVGTTLVVEVRGLAPVAGTVRWVRGAKAGVQFDEAQDLGRVFAPHGPDGTIARAPRFPLVNAASAAGRLRLGDRPLAVEALDVSAGGAKLAIGDAVVCSGQTGALHLAAVEEPIFGSVCWVRDDRAGFRFAAPLSLGVLTRVLTA